MYVSVGAQVGPRHGIPLQLEAQVAVSHLTWELGTKHGSSARAVCAHKAAEPALRLLLHILSSAARGFVCVFHLFLPGPQ